MCAQRHETTSTCTYFFTSLHSHYHLQFALLDLWSTLHYSVILLSAITFPGSPRTRSPAKRWVWCTVAIEAAMRKAWAKFIWIDHGRCANGRQAKVNGEVVGEIIWLYTYQLSNVDIYIYLKCILVPIEYTWLYILSTCWIMWNTWHGLVMDEPNWIAAFIRWKMQEVETDRLNLAKLWCLNKLRRMQWKSMLIPEQTLTLPAPPKRPLLWLLLPCLIAEEPSPRCHLAARRDPTKGLMFRCVEDSSFFATCTGTRYVYR